MIVDNQVEPNAEARTESGEASGSDRLISALYKFAAEKCNCEGEFVDYGGKKRCLCIAAAERLVELERRNDQ